MWRSPLGCIAALVMLVAPLAATAQPPGQVVRIGWLFFGLASTSSDALDGLRQGLRELGYVEGQNLVLEQRYAEGHYERLPALAADLVRLRVEVLVAAGSAALLAAQRTTSTVPIVMVGGGGDPGRDVAAGFIASLAQPGGN